MVAIWAHKPNQQTNVGSGFFGAGANQIITAYHVIEGADNVTIYDAQKRSYANPTIFAIDPGKDLAILTVDASQPPYVFALAGRDPGPAPRISIFGNPWGVADQVFEGQSTSAGSTGYLTSSLMNGPGLLPVFSSNHSIDIIPMDVTGIPGMSGAPVIGQDGRVIGIYSGSLSPHGRDLGWAIPAKYISALLRGTRDGRRISNVGAWPPLSLMAPNWISTLKSFSVGTTTAEAQSDVLLVTLWPQLKGRWKLRNGTSTFTYGVCQTITAKDINIDFDALKESDGEIDGTFALAMTVTHSQNGPFVVCPEGEVQRTLKGRITVRVDASHPGSFSAIFFSVSCDGTCSGRDLGQLKPTSNDVISATLFKNGTYIYDKTSN